MRILIWHVHGSWLTSFVQGQHEYLIPLVPDRGPLGRGRAQTWDWPVNAVEIPIADLREVRADVVILQRPEELELAERLTGRALSRELPAVYLEHNCPGATPDRDRHLLADRRDIPLVHVTHFNSLSWDSGIAPTFVIEHGVAPISHQWSGELDRAAVVINEPVRRGRRVGADLLRVFSEAIEIDLFGMQAVGVHEAFGLDPERVHIHGNLSQDDLHREMSRRLLYLHLSRWTSLGLSLVEAMHMGMPIVALAATEVPSVVPASAGAISCDVSKLQMAIDFYRSDRSVAQVAGRAAAAAASDRFGLGRFLDEWDELLDQVSTGRAA